MVDEHVTADFTTDPWWWEAARPVAAGDEPLPQQADVAVVGAGYTGLSAALTLAEAGRDVVVLESGEPGVGASTRSAGLVGRGLLAGFSDLAGRIGTEAATGMYRHAEDAYDHVVDLIDRHGIDCHLVHRGRFLPVWNQAQYDQTAADFEFQQRHLRIEGGMVSADEATQELRAAGLRGGLLITNTSASHPAMYYAGLLAVARRAGVAVRGDARVAAYRRESDRFSLGTARGTVAAREVVMATNAHTGREAPWFRRRLISTAATMAATEPLDPALLDRLLPSKRTYVDYSRHMFNYWRKAPDADRLLFGGQAGVMHKSPRAFARLLAADMARIFPELAGTRFSHLWQGKVAMTMDRLPHLGVHDGIHYALGNNGSGLPLGTYIGNRIALRLLGEEAGRTAFDDQPFRVTPSIFGYPWFMPVLTTWARWQDKRGVASKGH